MGSSRLPGKVLMPFVGGYTFLEWIVERAKGSRTASKVIVATTDSPKDDALVALCDAKKYNVIRGSEEDVLGRYHNAIRQFDSDVVVRVTADNPFVDIDEMDRVAEILRAESLAYADNRGPGLPIGAWSEAFTASAFERANVEANDPYEREHVTPYFYRHPELFAQRNIAPLSPHPFAPNARLTLDTPQDLELLTRLAKELGLSNPASQPSINEILSYLEAHQELAAINASVQD